MTTKIIVRGKVITPVIVSAFARRINSTDEIITQWANAAVLELTQNRNGNWIKELFDTKAFRLNGGGLNKLGTEVFQYIQAHYPRIIYNKETLVVGLKPFNESAAWAKSFVSVGDTEVNEQAGVYEHNGKFYRPQGDFALTFEEYKAFIAHKAPGDGDDKPVQAKQLVKAVEKAMEAQEKKLLLGSPKELVDLLESLGKLGEAVRAQMSQASEDDIEKARLDVIKAQERAAAAEQEADNAKRIAAAATFDLTPEEVEAIKASRAAAAETVKVESGKPHASRGARNRAAQALANTALTGEVKGATVEAPAELAQVV